MITLYGAKLVGEDSIVYVSSEIEDVMLYVDSGVNLELIRFEAETDDYVEV